MLLDDYFSRRVFRSPFVGYTEVVSGWSALGAFLFGPFYYWRKRAPIEALLSLVATVPLIGFSDQTELLGFLDEIDLSSLIWVAFAIAAPVLLPACYRRKGWDETTGQRSMVDVTDPFARSLARLDD